MVSELNALYAEIAEHVEVVSAKVNGDELGIVYACPAWLVEKYGDAQVTYAIHECMVAGARARE